MNKPTGKMKSEDHKSILCQGLHNLWEEQILCDAAIISMDMNNTVCNAHKVVLMSCSKFFYSELSSNRAGKDTVRLPEGSQEDISTILKFIYTGDLFLSKQNFEGVGRLAKLLQIKEAEKLFKEFSQSEIDLGSKNLKSALETKTKSTVESENSGHETPVDISELSALESDSYVKQTEPVKLHLQSCIKSETVNFNQTANSKSKKESPQLHVRRGKRHVIQNSKGNIQPGKDPTPLTNRIAKDTTQSLSRKTNVHTASKNEQTNDGKNVTPSLIKSQTLYNMVTTITSEMTEVTRNTYKPSDENKQRSIPKICSPSSTESDQGVKDFNFGKSPSRIKRRCFTPKKLEDFTLLKPQVRYVDVCAKVSPQKGKVRPHKVLSATEGELDVSSLNITQAVDGSKPNQTKKRSRGRPRKQVHVDTPKTIISLKTFDKRLTTDSKSIKKEHETKRSFPNALKDNQDIKRKRGRPKGSKNKKEVKVSETDCKDVDVDTGGPNSSDLTEDITVAVLVNSAAEMDSSVKSPNKLKKIKLICKGKKKPKCRRCYAEFDTASLLQRHRIVCRKTVPFDMPNKYKRKRCGTCQLSFEDYASFQEHRKIHKLERKKQFVKKPYACDFCDQTFRYENFLACHRFSKHKIPYDDAKFTVLTCQLCDYVTVNRWRHKIHMNQHENLRPYICEVCGKGFNASSSLATHKKSHSEGKHECPECGKKFPHQHSKVNHVRRVHKKEMPFLCHMCIFKCFGKSELVQHLDRDHDIPLPKGYVRYKCELCDFMTFRKFHFDNHMNVHSGERQFECKVCHKKYLSKMVLRSHMQFHKEPKHKCTWESCKYAAVQKNRLEQHIRLMHTHQDEKPFPCHLCTYRAALQGNLSLHLRNVHNIDIRKRKLMSHKRETTGCKAEKKEDNSDYQMFNLPMTNINSSDIVQMAVASCGDISSSSVQSQDQSIETETIVIYTTDSVIPAQLTVAQVNELRRQNSTVVSNALNSMAGAQTVTIVTPESTVVHMPETQNPVTMVTSEDGTVVKPNYQEQLQRLVSTDGSEMGEQIHFQDNVVMSQNEGEHVSALPQNIHTELTVLNNHLHQESTAQSIPGDESIPQDMQSVQVHNVDNEEITSVELAPNLDQDVLNTQYTGECYLPESRNLNLLGQTMETREALPDQNAYWTNF